MAIQTHGLTHIALGVRDVGRAFRFYQRVCEPFVFATDPDGYTIEIWYEIPTRVDPPDSAQAPRGRRRTSRRRAATGGPRHARTRAGSS
jgi:hypothetical protein